MKIALTEKQLKFIKKNVVTPLKKKGAQIFAFGSRTTGTYNEFSDLDILVRASKDSIDNTRQEISQISEKLVESNFPYKVDLVLEEDLAESYKENVKKQLISFSNL